MYRSYFIWKNPLFFYTMKYKTQSMNRCFIYIDFPRRNTSLLCMSFAQIRKLRSYQISQYGLNDTIIIFPIDFDKVQQALPRKINETRTIAVKLKWKLQYKNVYAQGNVRPTCVINSLTSLGKTSLYTKYNIYINKDWEALLVKIIIRHGYKY